MKADSNASALALDEGALSRRSFLKFITFAAATIGLPATAAAQMAEAVATRRLKPVVVWLHFQECTGCTESLLRTSAPGLAELILDLVSVDYHETLMAAAGAQAESVLKDTIEKHAGKYICVVEGAIPTKDGGIYCKIGDRTAMDLLTEVGGKAGAVIALGSCASWGGIPSSPPNPTGAVGAPSILKGKPVVTLPGCPANPYIFLGTALQFATFGTLPKLDDKGRPLNAYARTIHEDCPRRAHFDAGQFAKQFGDEGHRQGWCLYELGCKGPQTHASCSLRRFGEVDAWPIGVGHPCFGCTEEKLAFKVPLHDNLPIERPTPPETYPAIQTDREPRHDATAASGLAGFVGGAIVGGVVVAAKKLSDGSTPPAAAGPGAPASPAEPGKGA